MLGNPSVPKAPNYAPLIQASQNLGNTETGMAQSQLDWAKGAYGENLDTTRAVQNSDLDTANRSSGFANDIEDQYRGTYMPLQDKFAKEAQDYSNPDRIADNMGRAQATTAQQFDQARQGAQQELEGYGVDPSATRFGALDIGLRAQKAAAMAAAGNNARVQTENTGLALESQAIGQGQAEPGMVAGTRNTGLQAGSQAVNTGLATTASGANTMGTAPGYYNMANGAYGMAGNLMNTQYGNQMSQYKAQNAQSSGVGALLGAGLGGANDLVGAVPIMLAKGGAVPATDEAEGPFVPHHFYVIPGHDEAGHRMPIEEATQRYFKTGHHLGVYPSVEHASFAHGGAVACYAEGGGTGEGDSGYVDPSLSPSAGANTDDIQANGGAINLNAGEYVIPKDVTQWLGHKQLQSMIDKARQEAQGATAKPTVGPKKQQAVPVEG